MTAFAYKLPDHDRTEAPMTRDQILQRNLDIVDAHMKGEGQDPASVMDLYTDDIVLEMPTRGITLTGKANIEANYRRMFGAMELLGFEPIDRFATEDRVVDDCRVRFKLLREGFDKAPLPIGATVELRLVHIFRLRDGLICHEIVIEGWTQIEAPSR